MLSKFPLYIEGQLDIFDRKWEDFQIDNRKTSGCISLANWHSKFCLLMEKDSKLYIFNDEQIINQFPNIAQDLNTPDHISRCRLDTELDGFRIEDRLSYTDNITGISMDLINRYNKKNCLNPSLFRENNIKTDSRRGLFWNGSRFFGRGKSNTKFSVAYQPKKSNCGLNNQLTKNENHLKRSLSLSRVNRKKSIERVLDNSNSGKIKNTPLSQSTGDLTVIGTSPAIMVHFLDHETVVSEMHPSLVGGRPHCFSVRSPTEEMDLESSLDNKPMGTMTSTRLFAASSHLEKQCWIKRLQQTLKPNLENENRVHNSLRLTIFESKSLPLQKCRYYCTVSLDKNLYALTTDKLSADDGSVFWAEDIVLNNLPNFKNLTIAVYKESDSVKYTKRRKKKSNMQSRFIGQINFSFSTLNGKNEIQSWYNLKSDIPFDRASNYTAQLRIKIRLKSLKVLKNSAYSRLHDVVINNYKELIPILDKNLPIKLKEEIAICLVNIHEKNGSIIQFLIDLITIEINEIDNNSMTLRANTIVTKIIEYHMKFVGFQYLHDTLYPFIRDVFYNDETVEVDPSRYDSGGENNAKLLLDNQKALVGYLKFIWDRIYDSKNSDFPKQLRSVFVGWRQKLTSRTNGDFDQEALEDHCDIIVSGCIFLRLLCPAILSPYLFGIVPFLSEKATVQRTLTLVAKSLQSLANFSNFGEKEQFMTFLNRCFEEEIPRMKDFLRCISSDKITSVEEEEEEKDAVYKEIHYYGVPIDLPVEMACLYNCLMSDPAKEVIANSPRFQDNSRLSDIIDQLSEQLKSFIVTPSKLTLKKISNIRSIGHRRTLSTHFLNTSDLGISISSPPLLLNYQETNVTPQYISSNNIEMLCGNDIYDIPCRETKPRVTHSPKSPKLTDNSFRQKVNITPSRRATYRSRDDSPPDLHSCLDKSPTTSNPPMIPPRKPARRSISNTSNIRVNDNEVIKPFIKSTNTFVDKIEVCDIDFYKENPTYGIVYGSVNTNSARIPCHLSNKSIDKYFSVRLQIQGIKNENKGCIGGEINAEKQQLPILYRELESIKKEILSEQDKDLMQLLTMLNLNKTCTDIPSPQNSVNNSVSNDSTTDELDKVISSISVNQIGLERSQESLRKSILKPMVSPKPPRLKSPSSDIHGHPLAIESPEPHSPDSPPNRVHLTSSSSNSSSSLRTGLFSKGT